MSVIDIVLVVAAISFAIAGYRQGFIVGIFSFTGFLAGGIGGVFLAPHIVGVLEDELGQAILAVAVVLGLATVGQLLGSVGGAALRARVTWEPGHVIDAGAGGVLGVLSLLVVAWFVGSALATAPIPDVTQKVKQSEVLAFVDRYMPDSADQLYASLSRVLDKNGLTQVFGPFDNENIVPVEAPESGVAKKEAIRSARDSIVKVEGAAFSCRRALEGTGFVYADDRVMTNAHVVAGVDEPTVSLGGTGDRLKGQVVLFDEDRDVAVIAVPGLDAPSLEFNYDGDRRDSAVVAGFPLNGPYQVEKARIREEINARGPDIYNSGVVQRRVFSLFAQIEPGNSGGPLLSPDGEVYGVIFAKSVQDAQTGYALTADEVRSDAERGIRADGEVSTGSCV